MECNHVWIRYITEYHTVKHNIVLVCDKCGLLVADNSFFNFHYHYNTSHNQMKFIVALNEYHQSK